MGPGLLSGGAVQINVMVGTIVASLQAGAVSWLYYADRVYQLPLGLIGIALGVVLLPDLARKLRAGNETAAHYSMNRGLEISLLLTLPATVALLVVPLPIMIVLFERGAFDRQAAEASAWALAAFATGLPAYILLKPLQAGFFAREDTVTPLKMASVSVLVNVVLSVALFFLLQPQGLGHVGIALATALAAWLHAGMLGARLLGMGFLQFDARLKRRMPRALAASLVMGLLLWGASLALMPWFDAGAAMRVSGLAILVAAGLGAYFGLAVATRALEREDIKLLLRRR